jgi:hypothetical protein
MTDEQKEIDVSDILLGYHENTWVALARDYSRVIASAKTLRELMQKMGDRDVIYHRVLPNGMTFAPTIV